MTSEVREAAGRLRQIKTTSEAVVYLDHPLFLAGFSFAKAIAYDKGVLANAYLAEHADDDELPIDEAYWQSLLSGKSLEGNNGICLWWERGTVRLESWSGDDAILLLHIKTRGQLRRLCEALNIPLQPIGQEQKQ